jgi:GT2 family glycosyltransferase
MSRNRNKKTKTEEVKYPKINALIDIVYPVYGQYQSFNKSLGSIADAVADIPWKLYVTDDCSKDYETTGKILYQQLKTLPNLGSLQIHKENMGYGKTVNDAAMVGRAKYILVMTTDVYLTPNSVKIMVDHLEHNPQLAIISPKMLFPPDSQDPQRPAGKVQHVGIVYNVGLQPYHLYSGWDANHPVTNQVRDVNAVTGACFLIRRNVWQQLKGFALDYGKGTFEDLDLCTRVRMMGLGIRVLPQAIVYHYANLSVLAAGEGYPMDRNSKIFHAKFGDIIPYDDWLLTGLY